MIKVVYFRNGKARTLEFATAAEAKAAVEFLRARAYRVLPYKIV